MIEPISLDFDYGWVTDDALDLSNALNSEEIDFENGNPEGIRNFLEWATDKAESISGMLESLMCAYEDYLYDLENPDDEDE